MKNIKIILALAVIFLLIGGVAIGDSVSRGWWNGSDDLRIAVYGLSDISLVNISPKRGLVSELVIKKTVNLWIPWGLGWYQTDRISRLLTQEKKWEMAYSIPFYNYGFWPDRVLRSDLVDNWNSWENMIKTNGIINGIRLKRKVDSLLVKSDESNVDSDKNVVLDEWLARDYADTRLLNEETMISVLNASKTKGVADWLSQRLGWAGLTITNTESVEQQAGCGIYVSDPKINKYLLDWIVKVMKHCQINQSSTVLPNEIELVVGDDWVKMIQYSKYVRSF